MKRRLIGLMLFLLIFGGALTVFADGDFAITWSLVSGGGGQSSGGTLDLAGSIGQAGIGEAGSGAYGVSGGYWSVTLTTPTPPDPPTEFDLFLPIVPRP